MLYYSFKIFSSLKPVNLLVAVSLFVLSQWFNNLQRAALLTSWVTEWAIPENIHTYTMDGFQDFRRGVGAHDYGILRAWGVFTIGNPEAWGDFTCGDFTCGNFTCGISGVESGVSSLKTLIAVDLSSS